MDRYCEIRAKPTGRPPLRETEKGRVDSGKRKRLAWGRSSTKGTDKLEGLLAKRTKRNGGRLFWLGSGSNGQEIKKNSDALETLFCGGRKPAVNADAAEALGQDVLEKAGQERKNGKPGTTDLPGYGIAITEGNESVFLQESALGTQGGAVNVAGKISQHGLAGADGKAVDNPRYAPDRRGNLRKERGMFLQSTAEP